MIQFASRYYPKVAERFVVDAADHQMTVLHDDGLYRHVRFKAPDTGMYRFDLVTWPGYLSITGDVAAFTFTRVEDMFEFFASGVDINPHYWAEKIVAEDTRSRGTRAYSEQRFRQHVADVVRDHIKDEGLRGPAVHALWQTVREELFDEAAYEETARAALDNFQHESLRFRDTWEWDLRDFTWHYLWSCCAIRWGIDQYRGALVRAGERR